MTDDVKMLRPFPASVGVQVHAYSDGDVVSEVFVDAATGDRYILLRDPATAHQLGQDMLTATTDPDIAAEANRMRDAQ